MDLAARERVGPLSAVAWPFDVPTLLVSLLVAPLLGLAVGGFLFWHGHETEGAVAFWLGTPLLALAVARARRAGWVWGTIGAVLALTVAGTLLCVVTLYLWWEIGNSWGGGVD